MSYKKMTLSIFLVVVMRLIEGRLHDDLKRIILQQAPNEAAGIILTDGTVVEMSNHSNSPHNTFELNLADITSAIEKETDTSNLILWHSHPSGGIGPSRIDLRQKTAFPYHLVLSLVEGEIIPTWY
jgi:proteasome lid subunit RPN8/RPN11